MDNKQVKSKGFYCFLDTNVFLNYLLKRPGEKEAGELFDLADNSEIHVFTSSTCILQIIYFLKKDGHSNSSIKVIIENILSFIQLADAPENVFKAAFQMGFSDLEDAVQYCTTLQIKDMDYFITSNTKDYKNASARLPVLTPEQFIKI